MKVDKLRAKIKALGGNSTAIPVYAPNNGGYSSPITGYIVQGTLNGYDIDSSPSVGDEIDFYTTRSQRQRGEYDAGSDYNPGGFQTSRKIKDLEAVASGPAGDFREPDAKMRSQLTQQTLNKIEQVRASGETGDRNATGTGDS